MIAKNFVLVLIATILTLSVASALSFSSVSDFSSVNQVKSVTLTNNDNASQSISFSVSNYPGFSYSVPSTISNLANGSSSSFNVQLNSVPDGLEFGTYTSTLNANGALSNSSLSLNYVKSFCKNGTINEANLSIRNIDISNNGNGDDNEWDLLDTVSIDVEVEAGDFDVDDVVVEMGLFDSSGKNVVNDLDFSNTDEETFEIGDLNDGDKETATFEFRVPADMDSSGFRLAFKTYSTKSGNGEAVICDDNSGDLSNNIYESIDINEASDKGKYITFQDVKTSPSEVTCGDNVILDANVFNVGKNDEDKVKVHLISSELKIDQSYEISKGLNKGDNSRVSFSFAVPTNIASKTYNLRLSSEYNYRNGIYRQDSDDDTIVSVKVIGCSPVSTVKQTGVTVSPDSATAGKDYTIVATIKNLGNTSATFEIDASNYDSWATLTDVSDSSITLAAGQSRDVTFTFKVKSSASGDNTFNIVSTVNGNTESKQVPVSVESSSSLGSIFKGNSLVWVIGLVNLILIILIVIVAVKVARR